MNDISRSDWTYLSEARRVIRSEIAGIVSLVRDVHTIWFRARNGQLDEIVHAQKNHHYPLTEYFRLHDLLGPKSLEHFLAHTYTTSGTVGLSDEEVFDCIDLYGLREAMLTINVFGQREPVFREIVREAKGFLEDKDTKDITDIQYLDVEQRESFLDWYQGLNNDERRWFWRSYAESFGDREFLSKCMRKHSRNPRYGLHNEYLSSLFSKDIDLDFLSTQDFAKEPEAVPLLDKLSKSEIKRAARLANSCYLPLSSLLQLPQEQRGKLLEVYPYATPSWEQKRAFEEGLKASLENETTTEWIDHLHAYFIGETIGGSSYERLVSK